RIQRAVGIEPRQAFARCPANLGEAATYQDLSVRQGDEGADESTVDLRVAERAVQRTVRVQPRHPPALRTVYGTETAADDDPVVRQHGHRVDIGIGRGGK